MSARTHWLTRQRIGALLFLALSLFYGWQIQDIPQLPVDALEAMNARSMPWALAAVGAVLSLALFVAGGDTPQEQHQDQHLEQDIQSDSKRHQPANILTAVALLVWTALYATLLGWLGFFTATAGFLLGGFFLLGERRPTILIGVAFGAALLLFGLLRFGFGLYLPQGSLWVLLGIPDV